jgi:hypothetical protein
MLAIAAGTFICSTAMTPVQILVFCLVAALYSSCLVTFGVLARDLVRGGWGHRGLHHRCLLIAAGCVWGSHVREFDKKEKHRGDLLPMEK